MPAEAQRLTRAIEGCKVLARCYTLRMPSTNPQISIRLSPAEHAKLVEHAADAGAPSVAAFSTGIIRGALTASTLSPRALEMATTLAERHNLTPAAAVEAALDLAVAFSALKNWKPTT